MRPCCTGHQTETLLGGQGDLTDAIDNYHIALGSRPEDTFTAEMLKEALQEECAQYSHELLVAG